MVKRNLLTTLLLLLTLAAQAARHEAESGKMTNCETISDSKYSGRRAVRMTQETSRLTLTVNATQRQKYTIRVAAEGIGGQKDVRCTVNGASTIFKTGSYGEVEIGTYILNEGQNEIVITPSWTWFSIDYVSIEEATSNIDFELDRQPVTPDATPAACTLYSFLRENFGQRTIAGMMTGSMDAAGTSIKAHEDVTAVYKASGRYPALIGFDLMNTTGLYTDRGDSWYKNYATKVVTLAKDTWRRGGIPDFTWHWRDPSRQTNEFYTDQVSFDFTTALNADGTWNTASTLYRNIIRDIDLVADCFLQLQQQQMACIFRPLHEASGGWFWWGSKGADAYKRLYRLIYDEMVNVKGVRNVIWDWNADPSLGATWCPGTEYFDVVSTDIYNEQYDYSSNYPAFDRLKELTQGHKIIALAENGPIPDPAQQEADQAMWSWWMPWYQSWGGNFVAMTSTDQWRSTMSDPRVLTLQDMPGWEAYAAGIATTPSGTTSHTIYSLSGIRLSTLPRKGIVIVDGQKRVNGILRP